MKIVVIGGSRLIGLKLVNKLRAHGHEAVAASPTLGVNTLTGQGLTEALDGAAVVIDAGVGHHVALSVVGTERLSENGYFRAKIAQETLIKSSSIPYSIVHATQFFEFVTSVAEAATDGDTVRLAPVLIQPIAAEDVATAVGRISVGSPVNGITEVAGPEQFRLNELIRQGLVARNDPRDVVADPHARYFGAELRERTLLPGDDAILAETRFNDWLSQSTSGK
jgi:uncharacterized protein YbjT (DUF2867 family)